LPRARTKGTMRRMKRTTGAIVFLAALASCGGETASTDAGSSSGSSGGGASSNSSGGSSGGGASSNSSSGSSGNGATCNQSLASNDCAPCSDGTWLCGSTRFPQCPNSAAPGRVCNTGTTACVGCGGAVAASFQLQCEGGTWEGPPIACSP